MNVLHINSYNKKGGAEIVFNVSRKNKTTKNYCGYVKELKSDEEPDLLFHNWENSNKIKGIINYIFSFKNYILLKKFLEKNNIDVIHLHGFFSSISPSILLAIKKIKKKKNIKTIQTLHDFHLICPNSSLFNFNKNKICEKCVGKKYKLDIIRENCDRRGLLFSIIKGIRSLISNNILKHQRVIDIFICPSEFIKTKLLQEGIKESKITLLHNPIDIKINEPLTKENIVCYFGRFSREKNIKFLINAFSTWKEQSNNNFILLLIGEGEEYQDIINSINNSKYKNDIIVKKFMSQRDLFKEISNAKYFSLTSKCYEVAPVSIIEALTLDIIPIAPDIGGMRESIVKISKVGLTFSPEDINSWINTINTLENTYEERINALRKYKHELINNFSLENYTNKLSEIYKRLISSDEF